MNKRAMTWTAVLAGAAFALGAGAGTAAAQDQGTLAGPVVGNASTPEGRAMTFGFGSLGTESLATTLSTVLNEAWLLGSLTVPNATGLNAVPGSTGSYDTTPWFGSGQALFGSAAGSLQGF